MKISIHFTDATPEQVRDLGEACVAIGTPELVLSPSRAASSDARDFTWDGRTMALTPNQFAEVAGRVCGVRGSDQSMGDAALASAAAPIAVVLAEDVRALNNFVREAHGTGVDLPAALEGLVQSLHDAQFRSPVGKVAISSVVRG